MLFNGKNIFRLLPPLLFFSFMVGGAEYAADSDPYRVHSNLLADIPIYPGAVGFGRHSFGGSGRNLPVAKSSLIFVTNLNTHGPGSLMACIVLDTPRTCIFKVSGVIDYRRFDGRRLLNINKDFITIAGESAPGNGITVVGARLRIQANDVLIRHIRFRLGDDKKGEPGEDRDALTIIGKRDRPNSRPYNVVIDHASFSWGVDEVVAIKDTARNITISNSIIAEGLHDAGLHPKGPHSKCLMTSGNKVTLSRNLIANCVDRGIHDTSPGIVVVNNVLYNIIKSGIRLRGLDNNSVYDNQFRTGTYIGNVRLASAKHKLKQPTLVQIEENKQGSRVYIDESACPNASSPIWPCVSFSAAALPPNVVRSDEKQSWNEELSVIPIDETERAVLMNCGANPANRDNIDRRIIEEVRSRNGTIKNSVSEAGGWPSATPLTTEHKDLPKNHNQIMPSGYTQLEEWLHLRGRLLERRP